MRKELSNGQGHLDLGERFGGDHHDGDDSDLPEIEAGELNFGTMTEDNDIADLAGCGFIGNKQEDDELTDAEISMMLSANPEMLKLLAAEASSTVKGSNLDLSLI